MVSRITDKQFLAPSRQTRTRTPLFHLLLIAVCLLFSTACDTPANLIIISTPTPLPPTATPEPTPTATPAPTSFGRLQSLITDVENAKRNDRTALVNQYMVNIKQAPLIEGNRVTFLYRGAGHGIQLIGDMTSWTPENAILINRISDTDLWWYSAEYEPTARLDYQFVINEQPILDPLNSRTVNSALGLRSELIMPDYVAPDELTVTGNILSGTLHEHQLQSTYLGQQRVIFVYEPPGQLVGAQRPSIYVHDGAEAMSLLDMRNILNGLFANRQIPPLVTVFIPAIDRTTEYVRNDNYADFVAQEVVPFVQATYNTDPAADKTATFGTSLGGLMSLHIGLRHPDIFGLVASQSGEFAKSDSAILKDVANLPTQPLKIHLVVGTYETAVFGNNDPEGNILSANRALAAALEDKAYTYQYTEFAQGHSWGFWQSTIGDALRYLYR